MVHARDLLRVLGVADERVVVYDPRRTYVGSPTLAVRGLNPCCDIPARATLARVRAAVAAGAADGGEDAAEEEDGAEEPAGDDGRRIALLLDRADAPTRRLRARDAELVRDAMRAAGFTVLSGGDGGAAATRPWPPRDEESGDDNAVRAQAAAFARAALVVAPHGAALANLAHMRAGRAVIELRPPIRRGFVDDPDGEYAHLARSRGLRYECVAVRGTWDGACVEMDDEAHAGLEEALARC